MLLSCWIPYDNGYFAETFAVASGVNVEDNHVSFEDCNNIDGEDVDDNDVSITVAVCGCFVQDYNRKRESMPQREKFIKKKFCTPICVAFGRLLAP